MNQTHTPIFRVLSLALGVGASALFADQNTWVAGSSSDGLASSAANWSLGRLPVATDDIVLDGSGDAPLLWDAGVNGLPAEVASWTQSADYTNAVTFPTQYNGSFACFRVAGDVVLAGGSWTHPANADAQVYRLNVAVDGDLSIGANALLDARGKGYAAGCFPVGGAAGVHGGGNISTAVYGNVYEPIDIGAGNTGDNNRSRAGGGAVKLAVGGAMVLDGTIRVDSTGDANDMIWYSITPYYAGAAGSIWIEAASLSGSGSLQACGGAQDRALIGGSGGRVAITLTEAESLGLPIANIKTHGTKAAYNPGANASGCAGAGTLVVKLPGQTYGTLYVNNTSSRHKNTYGATLPSVSGTTIVPAGATWTFDAIVFDADGILMVPEGATLALPQGLACVRGINRKGGILLHGGELSLPEGPQTLQNTWTLSATTPATFDFDLTVKDNASLGCLPLNQRYTAPLLTDITVAGNLIVDRTGYLSADSCGFVPEPDYLQQFGGENHDSFFSHGGQIGVYGYKTNVVYGSVLNPVLPGTFGYFMNGTAFNGPSWPMNVGGGALKLTVTGKLTLNGKASSTAPRNQYNTIGVGGSINLTVGQLDGTGSISVKGDKPDSNFGTGTAALIPTWNKLSGQGALPAGGRIAIRLTQPGATFSSHWRLPRNISALGLSWNGRENYPNVLDRYSSPGTIYLQDGNTEEGFGTIAIYDQVEGLYNWTYSYNLHAYTVLPSLKDGVPVDDLHNATLDISQKARVSIGYPQLYVRNTIIDNTSVFELNGNVLKTWFLTVNGTPVRPGTYYPGDPELQGIIVDQDNAGGSVFVCGDITPTLLRLL